MVGNLLSFLNRHKYEIAYRGWNGLTAGAVAFELYNNPTAKAAEYLPDIALHSIEAFIPDTLPPPFMIGLNVLRAGQAGFAFITGQAIQFTIEPSIIPFGIHGTLPYISFYSNPTTIPAAANATDVLNHALNVTRHLKDLMTSPTTSALPGSSKTLLMSKRPSTTLQPNNDTAKPQHRYETRSKAKAASM
ncbi:MAG: hypothetical protein AB7I18_04810 [Candidatus Berkiella sp.]